MTGGSGKNLPAAAKEKRLTGRRHNRRIRSGEKARGRQKISWKTTSWFCCACKKLMRIMGLDYGSKTVGVAVSDALLLTAQGVETIERKDEGKLRKTCARIEALAAEYEVERIVLGLPKNMNNTEGERVEKTREFGAMLERRTGLPVDYWDERLTTVAAEQVLMESGVRRENRKAVIDKVAACLILQGYLDHLQNHVPDDAAL